jgi:RNA polymerase sigma factor (TIGR02999 family)
LTATTQSVKITVSKLDVPIRAGAIVMSSLPHSVTQLLLEWRRGNHQALDQLMPLVYDELRRLAQHYMRSERPDHTLQATALVNEAYLRLIDSDVSWQDRAHFFAVAARLMRRILVDHAKFHRRSKRGSGAAKVSLDDVLDVTVEPAADVVELDEALQSLEKLDPRKSQIVELHFFGGLGNEEVAEALNISRATVQRELKMAKAWLKHELRDAR